MILQRLLSIFTCLLLLSGFSYGQSGNNLSKLIQSKRSGVNSFQTFEGFTKVQNPNFQFRDEAIDHSIYRLDKSALSKLLRQQDETIKIPLEFNERPIDLLLTEYEILASGFNVQTSSGIPFEASGGAKFYRGIIDGDEQSVVALSFMEEKLIGVIDSKLTGNLVFGKLDESDDEYILYNQNQLRTRPDFSCDAEVLEAISDQYPSGTTNSRVDNCVNVYFECEHDFYLEEGSVQNTVDQISGIFNIVATLYANEAITTKISEIKVWDTPDSYATSSTSNALTSFRSQVPSYNGDLAHLVSRGAPSGGGIAWVNALCSSYGYSYSYIYSSYNQLPAYSWTTNVITHEMGHNLGSPHTHSCAWNGNNTAIDGCAAQAGYGDNNCATPPLPTNGGTIMSYCHLVGGVGINFANGFGPQPGDLIRSRVSGGNCLSACVDCTDEGLSCDDSDPCTINDTFDANCNCAGTPAPDADNDGVCDTEDLCPGFDDNLIGSACNDGDACTVNDTYGVDCNCAGTLADSDGDGVCDGEDICAGFDDNIDSDGDGVPDGCDLDCSELTGTFSSSSLSHSGGGSSSISYSFDRVSQDISFVISGLNALTGGKPSNRYIEFVEVTYVDENGVTRTAGSRGGDQSSTYNVNISARALSVQVTLSDSYDGNASGLSVNLGSISYCEDDNVCLSPDSDGDGVCDAEDICPGFDDSIDSDNDGIPDGCDNCSSITYAFSSNNLSHSGTGSNTVSSDFGGLANQVSFVVSDLGARLNGKGSRRYDEEVTISYVDASGSVQTYGIFTGSSQGSVVVNIASAQSVSVSLADAYDGNSETAMSVSLSSIESCGASLPQNLAGSITGRLSHFNFWPNPSRDAIRINYDNEASASENVKLRIYDMKGMLVKSQTYSFQGKIVNEDVDLAEMRSGIYMIQLLDGEKITTQKLIVLR